MWAQYLTKEQLNIENKKYKSICLKGHSTKLLRTGRLPQENRHPGISL